MAEFQKYKKKICWITNDYFLDSDTFIVPQLSTDYEIEWHIIYSFKNYRFKPEDLIALNGKNDLHIKHFYMQYRLRNLKNILFFYKILNNIRKQKPEIIYVNFIGLPYFIFTAALILRKSNTIFAAHQAEVHDGLDYNIITKIYYRFWYSWFTYFNLFSTTQGNIFKKLYPNKVVFIIPLALKEFGKSNKKRINDKIVFFNFGTIRANKNIGCLIEAAFNLYQKGIKGFHVVIKGECENWKQYKQKIKFPELFTCDIRMIDNKEIADMFQEYHYLVLPYNSVSQSGILKIAYYYNVPVIASDLEEFKSEIEDGISGYIFKNKDVEDLEIVMKKVLDNHIFKYDLIRKAQKDYTERNLTLHSILKKYHDMFNSILQCID